MKDSTIYALNESTYKAIGQLEGKLVLAYNSSNREIITLKLTVAALSKLLSEFRPKIFSDENIQKIMGDIYKSAIAEASAKEESNKKEVVKT